MTDSSKLPNTTTTIPRQVISTHTTRQSCWIIIHGQVYDVTGFLNHHPGGADVILEAAATRDATAAYEAVHSLDLLRAYTITGGEEEEEEEGMCRLVGVVEEGGEKEDADADAAADASVKANAKEVAVIPEREVQVQAQQVVVGKDTGKSMRKPWRKPELEECLNLDDFEHVASRVISEAAWAYYSSGADDEVVSVFLFLFAITVVNKISCGFVDHFL